MQEREKLPPKPYRIPKSDDSHDFHNYGMTEEEVKEYLERKYFLAEMRIAAE